MDPDKEDKKKVELYEMLVDLLAREEKCKEKVRKSEEEVQEILNERTREEAASELDISVYDTERNEKARRHREELVRSINFLEMWLDYMEQLITIFTIFTE